MLSVHHHCNSRFVVLLFCTLASANLLAAEIIEEPLSSASISLGRDDANINEISLNTDIEFKNSQRLDLMIARAKDDNNEIEFKTNSIGLTTDPFQTFSIDFNWTETSQQQTVDSAILDIFPVTISDSVTLDSTRLSTTVLYNLENWQFGIAPSINTIALSLPISGELQLNVRGAHFEISYYGIKNLLLNINYFKASHSKVSFTSELSQANTLTLRKVLGGLLGGHIKTSAQSIETKSYSATIGRFFTWGNLSYTYKKSHTIEIANQSLAVSSHLLSASKILNHSLEFDVFFTHQNDSEDSSVQSLNLGLTYYW